MTEQHFGTQGIETNLLHGGQTPDPTTGSRAVPIYQTTSYVFRDTEHAQNLFGLAEAGNIYSRIMNPTVDVFEQRVALLEDGVAAVGTASGMSAITLAILNLANAGDEIIADSNLYGGTYNLFATTLPKYGITVKFVDATNPENFRAAITDKTKAIFGEIITNPSLNILDVEAVAAIAHENDLPLIIDNTFASPYGCKPITWGADIVVHSATKWIGGHGTSVGGIVVDGGRFNWNQAKYPGFTEPDESYNGIRFGIDAGPAAFAIKLRVQLLRDIGPALSPQNAFNFIQGLETLNLRVEKHNENAQKVAAYLDSHPQVDWVAYPGLESHPSHELAKKYLGGTFGSIITFGIKGGREAGRQLIDNINLWSHVANVGDAKSLIIHPASTTHQQLNADALKSSGVTEELVRLSIGLETVEDILQDLDQAIAKATDTRATISDSEENVINWAFNSPFAREEGQLRLKNIVVAGSNAEDDTLIKLKQLGYQITDFSSNDAAIDVLYILDPTKVEAIPTETKIVWFNTDVSYANLKEAAVAKGHSVVENRYPYTEADRIRRNNN